VICFAFSVNQRLPLACLPLYHGTHGYPIRRPDGSFRDRTKASGRMSICKECDNQRSKIRWRDMRRPQPMLSEIISAQPDRRLTFD
jgi:hypothetical protein